MPPLVSVIIPSYNHEKFVGEAIQSVLNQTFQDFEIIITDDGSSDKTLEKIKGFSDSRIRVFENDTNRGASYTSNRCILNATGKYIAMLSSDDSWHPNKLQKQVDYLENHRDVYAVFSKINWVDERSVQISNPNFYYHNVFEVKNRSQLEWLNLFFFFGNCLCHPSSLIRHTVYDEIGMFNPMLAILPDFDFWTRLCLHYEIYILDEKLVNFRHFADETNASGANASNSARTVFEARQILSHYKKINNVETFTKVFPTALQYPDLSKDDLHFVLGMLAIKTGVNYKIIWGQDLLFETLSNAKSAERIKRKYNFDYPNFIKLMGSIDPLGVTKKEVEISNLSSDSPNISNTLSTQKFGFPRNRNLLYRLLNHFHLIRNYSILASSSLFDDEYYLLQYPDVAQKGIEPKKHYLLYGADEGRNPSRIFNTKSYLIRYPDVRQSNINPLIHFILDGKDEGRNPL